MRSSELIRRTLAVLLVMALAGCEGGGSGSPVIAPKTVPEAGGGTQAKAVEKQKKEAVRIVGDRLDSSVATLRNTRLPQDPSPFRFAEVAKESGIDFVHLSGMEAATKHFPTANGSGVAMFDYDGDGKLDLYFATATFLPVGSRKTGPNKLYKNLGGGKFQDVTASSGLGFTGFCHGIIAGDLDNDGDADVFLCNYGQNVLYRNNGDGTFTDVSKAAGIARDGWSSGGAVVDFDNDGYLDIYVANYGIWTLPEDDQYCGNKEKGVRLYCSPRTIRTTRHFLYKNNRDGTFTDVLDKVIYDAQSKKFRARDDGHGFGVIAADFNGDGKIDIYVANDMNPNFLFLNRGDGTLEDVTEISGAAYNDKGQPKSGMGADAEDVLFDKRNNGNGDGLPELFVTNFSNESVTLYQNLGGGSFSDTTIFSGLGPAHMPWVGWGAALADFDNDGWPDTFVVNGHVDDNRRLLGQEIDYAEPALLHRNIDGNRFKLATRDAGPYFETMHVGRGAAFGDLDDDGDIDIVVNHKDGAPALLRNDTPKGENTWIRLQLVGTKSNRDGIGTQIKVNIGPRTIYRQRKGGCSLESTNDGRVLIGLGKAPLIDRITLRWPSGTEQILENVKPGQTLRVVEPGSK
jgi:enediyne biosynthesis protein E4